MHSWRLAGTGRCWQVGDTSLALQSCCGSHHGKICSPAGHRECRSSAKAVPTQTAAPSTRTRSLLASKMHHPHPAPSALLHAAVASSVCWFQHVRSKCPKS